MKNSVLLIINLFCIVNFNFAIQKDLQYKICDISSDDLTNQNYLISHAEKMLNRDYILLQSYAINNQHVLIYKKTVGASQDVYINVNNQYFEFTPAHVNNLIKYYIKSNSAALDLYEKYKSIRDDTYKVNQNMLLIQFDETNLEDYLNKLHKLKLESIYINYKNDFIIVFDKKNKVGNHEIY